MNMAGRDADRTRMAESRDNLWIAQRLRDMAALLEAQGDNPYRVAAYRHGAETVERLDRSVRELYAHEGTAGLDGLPAIGPRLAAAIAEMLVTGGWRELERMRGDADPETLLRTVPGVGPGLAHRLHESLGVETLEALELAASEGRLASLPRVGPRRSAAIGAALTQMLDRQRVRWTDSADKAASPPPPVEQLLDVDREYRERAGSGDLPTIAPRRFNPDAKDWLPVLHTRRGDWHLTAMHSNTARAHRLGRVQDWVVVYAEHSTSHAHVQHTVVTAIRGPLAGRRVVRGREDECARWYRGEQDTS